MLDDSLLEDLISEIDILSIESNWSNSEKKKQHKDSILGDVWTDDETSSLEDINDTDENCFTGQEVDKYLEKEVLLRSYIYEENENIHKWHKDSIIGDVWSDNETSLHVLEDEDEKLEKDSLSGSCSEEKENISPVNAFPFSNNVTVRKKSKKKQFLSECSELERNEDIDIPAVTRTLSYGENQHIDKVLECSDILEQKNNSCSDIDELDCRKIDKNKQSVECLTALDDQKYKNCSLSIENDFEELENDCEAIADSDKLKSEENMLGNFHEETSVKGGFGHNVSINMLREETLRPGFGESLGNNENNKSQNFNLSETEGNDATNYEEESDTEYKEITSKCLILNRSINKYNLLNGSYLDENDKVNTYIKQKTPIVAGLHVSDTYSDYNHIWECDDSVSNLKKSQCEKPITVLSDREEDALIPCEAEEKHVVEKDKPCKVRPKNVSHSTSSDDDFEAFLAEMKTPKKRKNTKCTPSMESFIVDDWIVSSDDEEVPPLINRITSNLHTITRNISTTSSLSAVVEKITVSSDEEQLPSLSKIKLLKHDEKNNFTTKTKNTPKQKKTPLKKTMSEKTPLKTSSVNNIDNILSAYLNKPQKFWNKSRDELSSELFRCYNTTIFDNKLPHDMTIIWNKQMTKTAGFCYYIGSSTGRKCRIELSEKVVDSCERIRDTLIHELCHAATWLIDGVKAGHGPRWKRWASKARSIHSDLPPISRCHSYEINYKFNYKCVKCNHRFGRHSKSINLKTSRCPYCLSHLELLPKLNKDGTPAKPRAPSKFSLFVKDNYGNVKTDRVGSSHQEIMKELSKRFAEILNKDEKL